MSSTDWNPRSHVRQPSADRWAAVSGLTAINSRLVRVGLLAALTVMSCGLEHIPVLYPPEAEFHGTSLTQARFRATADHDQLGFLGFELYYKFHPLGVGLEDLQNLDTISALTTAGFPRVHSSVDTRDVVTKPLIPIDLVDRGTEFVVVVDFVDEPFVAIDLPFYDEIPLRRGIYEAELAGLAQYYKSFRDVEDPGDVDLRDVRVELEGGGYARVTVVLYALSYGKADLFNPIYSEPVFLGEVEMSLRTL